MIRPLIVCDVDEVIVDFVAGLDTYLEQRTLFLSRETYALTGNIHDRQTGEPIDQGRCAALIADYQSTAVHLADAVHGSIAALLDLAGWCEIKLLTNIQEAHEAARRSHLERLGLSFPVTANTGDKGPAVRALANAHRLTYGSAPVVFLDDSRGHLLSAKHHVDGISLIQFIADDAFRALVRPTSEIGLITGDWREAHDFITESVGHPARREHLAS